MPVISTPSAMYVHARAFLCFLFPCRGEQVLKSFSKLCPSSSLVNRDGETLEIDSTTLIMGDVVTLK